MKMTRNLKQITREAKERKDKLDRINENFKTAMVNHDTEKMKTYYEQMVYEKIQSDKDLVDVIAGYTKVYDEEFKKLEDTIYNTSEKMQGLIDSSRDAMMKIEKMKKRRL